MIITNELVRAGCILPTGERVYNRIFIDFGDIVTFSVIWLYGFNKGLGWRRDTDNQDEYEVALVVLDNAMVMEKFVKGITFSPFHVGRKVTTYYDLELKEVNILFNQVLEMCKE